MFDIRNYQLKKAKGLVSVVKAGDSFAVATKKFSPETGENLPDEVVGVNIKELENRKIILQEEIKEIDMFLAELNVL